MALVTKFPAPGVLAGEVEGSGTALPSTGGSVDPTPENLVNANAVGTGSPGQAVIRPQGISGIAGNIRLFNSFTPETNRVSFDDSPIPEPQRSYDFRVYLPTLTGVRTPIAEATEATPLEATSAAPESIGGRYRKVAGMYEAPPLPLVLYHNQASEGIPGHAALEYLRAWKALVQNEDGTYNYPYSYLKDIFVVYRNVDQNTGYVIRYAGCFPLRAQPIRLQYQQNSRTVVLAEFSVERIKPNDQVGGLNTLGFNPQQNGAGSSSQTQSGVFYAESRPEKTSRGVRVLNV